MEILEKRKLIQEALGDKQKFDMYMRILASYFCGRLSKREMDYEAAKLLTLHKLSFHNQFFIAIMNKIAPEAHMPQAKHSYMKSPSQGHTHRAKGKEKSDKKRSSPKKLHSYREFQVRPPILATCVPRILPNVADALNCCSLLGAFPDVKNLHGCMYAYTLASELDEVPEACALYLAMSVKQFIKTILLNILSERSSVRLLDSFPYNVGACHINKLSQNANFLPPFTSNGIATSLLRSGQLRPKMKPTVQWAEGQSVAELSCDNTSYVLTPVNISELYNALMVKPKSIPVRFIYARILEFCGVKLRARNFM